MIWTHAGQLPQERVRLALTNAQIPRIEIVVLAKADTEPKKKEEKKEEKVRESYFFKPPKKTDGGLFFSFLNH